MQVFLAWYASASCQIREKLFLKKKWMHMIALSYGCVSNTPPKKLYTSFLLFYGLVTANFSNTLQGYLQISENYLLSCNIVIYNQWPRHKNRFNWILLPDIKQHCICFSIWPLLGFVENSGIKIRKFLISDKILSVILNNISSHRDRIRDLKQGSLWEWTQPMRVDVTL